MLSATETAQLRAKVQAAESMRQEGRTVRLTFVDGPLAGLDCLVRPGEVNSPERIIAWCMPTERGPVVTCYQPSNNPGQLTFKKFDYPGWRQSGRGKQ